ncbi:MAG: site-specific integrase [Acidimicrobiia bacterium]|nr:site-specific integrase [Acidimicrobiia bacterium]
MPGIKLPERATVEVVPLTVDEVRALTESVPERMRAMVTVGVGLGLRQGECFGLTVDRVDFLRRTVRVDRQLQEGGLVPPKTSASVRSIPAADVVLEALAEHLATFGEGPDGLIFATERGRPWRRSGFSDQWRRARADAGVRDDVTYHDLRHFYASALIHAGASVKAVQANLGHATAGETLDTYGHLWPDDEDVTRRAIGAVLGGDRAASARSV